MKGYNLTPSGELIFLGEETLSREILKDAEKAFGECGNDSLKNQLEAIFMSHFLENMPKSWNCRCGAIVNGSFWVGGARVAEHWMKGLPQIRALAGSRNGKGACFFQKDFPDFWFCCTKEDTPDGFAKMLTTKTFFSDMIALEEQLLTAFRSVYWTRLCPLEHPVRILHLAKTSLYSLTTVKAFK